MDAQPLAVAPFVSPTPRRSGRHSLSRGRPCPVCGSVRLPTARRPRITARRFLEGKVGLRYIVLTQFKSTRPLDGVDFLWDSWTRVRRSVWWKRHVNGCIVALDVTRTQEGSWRPHLNAFFESDSDFPFEAFNELWFEVTEHYGRAADVGTVREVTSFTKIYELAKDATLGQFFTAVRGRHLVRSYGSRFGLAVVAEANSVER